LKIRLSDGKTVREYGKRATPALGAGNGLQSQKDRWNTATLAKKIEQMPRFLKKETSVIAPSDAMIARPRRDQLEYRVITLNAGSNSVTSNTAAAML